MAYSQTNTRRLARGAGISVAGKFVGRFLGFAGDVAAARILGPALFGLYAIGWTLLRTLGLIAPLGLPNGVVRYIPRFLTNRPGEVGSLIRQSIIVAGLSGGLLGAGLYISAPWLAQSVYDKPSLASIFRLFSLSTPFLAVLSVTAAITRSKGEMKYTVMFEDIGQPLFGLILLLLFYAATGLSVTGVVMADVLSFFAAAFVGLWAVRRMFGGPQALGAGSRAQFGEVLIYSLPTAMAGALSVLVFWVDRLLVGYYLPARENGLYQAASQLSVVFVIVLAAFNAMLGPLYSDFHARANRQQMEEVYRVGTKWGLYVSVPIFLVLCFASQETLAVLFGGAYAGGSAALVVLAAGQLVNVGTGSVGTLLMMTGFQGTWVRLSFASLFMNAVMCALLIPQMGIVGGAISTTISLDTMYLVAVFRARALLGVWPYDRRYVKGIAATLVCTVVLIVTKALYRGPSTILFGLVIAISGAIFLFVLYRLGLDPEDTVALKWVRERLFATGEGPSA